MRVFYSERSCWEWDEDGMRVRRTRIAGVERHRIPTLTPELNRAEWVECRHVEVVEDRWGVRLHFVPADRPDGSRGVYSGVLVAS